MPVPEVEVFELGEGGGQQCAGLWLARAEGVHRQLRPALADYCGTMSAVFAGGGRMLIAASGDRVCGVMVFRIFADTANGTKCYVDDLVTDEAWRGHGVGHRLIQAVTEHARVAGASGLVLDSGVQRAGAHAFYFREGFMITSFNFKKAL